MGWIFQQEGIWRQKAIQEMTSFTLNRPVHFIRSFFGLFMWRLVVSSQTLSSTFHRVNLEDIRSFIFC